MANGRAILDLAQKRDAHVDERLRTEIIIWLATVRPDGRPHLVPVWFLWDNSESVIYIFSKPDQKIRNLKQNPNVVLALNSPSGNDVVTLEGTATLLEREAISTAHPAYAAKYKALFDAYGWTGESMSRSYSEPIRIEVTKVRA
ncbi:MAG: pyridoxamine 5'-phosphate oxidase family protein [Chloroflexota bacterium]|nr:pyridoxamine 5'-phosphate oxidase family protein [Chloroflexota bacterium]MDQ5864749.1 pyridoxamine 5'-phosphate oxidase family protein [Chloroflexota bacterium]